MYDLIPRLIYSLLTLYMLLIMLRWLGPWISIDVEAGRLRWIPRLTDPLLAKIRKTVPVMGPFDVAPPAALMGVWLVRLILTGA